MLGQDINNALEIIFFTDRQCHHKRVCRQYIFYLIHDSVKVGTQTVQLVDEDDACDFRFVGITPVSFGLRFYAARTTKYPDTTIEYFERSINFDGEVNVSRRINNVESVVSPESGCGSRLNGDAPFLLLLHEIRCCRTVVHFTNLVNLACQLQDSFCGCGFTSVNVGKNTDISIVCEICHSSGA